MAMIDIPSLFRDVLETPQQRQQRQMQEGMLRGQQMTSGLKGYAATQAPLIQTLYRNMPARQDALRRGVGGMLGLDVRTESEKLSDILKTADTSSPSGMINLSKAIQQYAPAQALQLRQAANEREAELAKLSRQEQLEDLQIQQLEKTFERAESDAEAQQTYRNYVAGLTEGTRFSGFAPGIKDGSVPQERLQKIVDQLTEKVDPKSLDIVAAVVGGEQRVLHSDGFGNYFGLDGQTVQLSEDDRVAPISATGTFEEVAGLSEDKTQEIRDMQVGVANFIAASNNTISLLEDNPDLNTAVSGISRVTADLAQNAEALARSLGYDTSDKVFDIETYSEDFDELGIKSSRLQASVLGLALQYAAAAGLGTGRALTDNDIKRAIQSLGFDRADPEAIIPVLRDRQTELVNRFKTVYEFNFNRTFEGSFGVDMDRPVSELID